MNHDTYLNSYLADILATSKNVAVLGASPDDKRPSHWISGFLLGKGYHVFPVNPMHRGERILGQHVYGSLAEIRKPFTSWMSSAAPNISMPSLMRCWRCRRAPQRSGVSLAFATMRPQPARKPPGSRWS